MITVPGSEQFLHILYLVAIAAEAITAALAAGRREMDWVGVCLLGCITALGGGSVRDVLLDHHPLSWVAHPSYLLITGGCALATIAIAHQIHYLHRLFLFLLDQLKKATGGFITINGSKHPIEIIVKDQQSNPNHAAEVAQELILDDKVDIVAAFSSPETVRLRLPAGSLVHGSRRRPQDRLRMDLQLLLLGR